MEDPYFGCWKCSCGALKEKDQGVDGSWRWDGIAWQHRCPGLHPQVGHNPTEYLPDPKRKYLKFTHPKMGGFLITEPNETKENVAENYLGDDVEPGDLDAFTITEVEMTQEAFDALPEFEG